VTVEPLALPDVLLIKPRVFRDDRGRLIETWRASVYDEHSIGPFVQDNASVSRKGVLRGLHFQHPHGQGKLVSALRGEVFDVAVDVRLGSPTFGRWASAILSGENGWQMYVPAGFAHGFLTLSEDAVFSYKCTDYYAPNAESCIRWSDPVLAIEWPAKNPILAPKDAAAPMLRDLPADALPEYRSPHA
jgi:dTDP-4-dehydrorhamnose 3,5-epimerase